MHRLNWARGWKRFDEKSSVGSNYASRNPCGDHALEPGTEERRDSRRTLLNFDSPRHCHSIGVTAVVMIIEVRLSAIGGTSCYQGRVQSVEEMKHSM